MANQKKKSGFEKWKDELQRILEKQNPIDRVLTILSLVCSGAIIVLALMVLFEIWDGAFMIFAPLMGIQLMLQAKLCWETSRKTAYKYLIAAGVVCLIIVLIMVFG